MGIDVKVIARQHVTNRFGNTITVTDDFDLRVTGQEALDVVNSDDPQKAYYDLLWHRGEGDDDHMHLCKDPEEQLDVAMDEIYWEDTKSGYIVTFNINRDHAQEFWDWCENHKTEGYKLGFHAY